MTGDELDLTEPERRMMVAALSGAAAQSTAPEAIWHDDPAPVSAVGGAVAVGPEHPSRFHNPLARTRVGMPRLSRAAKFALAFTVSAFASVLLLAAVALGLSSAYSNRALPGVRVGSVDVSGMTRDEVVAKLRTEYAYLGKGEVTITTPLGSATITYQEAGRGPDLEVMADAAMSVGRTGSPIGDAALILRTAIKGESLPVVVTLDPTALATRIHPLVGTSRVLPRDAQASLIGGNFAVSPSTVGDGIDEKAISSEIVDRLTQPDAPTDLHTVSSFATLQPQVSDKDAQQAVAAAQKMGGELKLVWDGTPPAAASASPSASPLATLAASASTSPSPTPTPTPTPAPTPVKSPAPPKTFTVDAATVSSWIVFGTRADGTYGPAVDPAQVQAYLSTLSPTVTVAPVEPWVVYDDSGNPVDLKAGKDGIGIDIGATSQAVEAYLDGLASGGGSSSSVAMVAAPVSPRVTLDSLKGMVKIGAWTTIFYPDISNGNGANIRVPAKLLNGQVVGPGHQFSFLNAVGPIDPAHGYTLGGVIKGGRSDHTGAMGGGICSASTTMFNAAARAGLQIDERHAHFYYIYRYPVGLDATVYGEGPGAWDMKWTNDTSNPILIRGYSTKGSKSTITIELWSLPLDRTVTFSPEFKANVVRAGDSTVYVHNLAPGQQNRAEFPTDGFDTSRTRTVTDSTGKVIHADTWNSHYTKVDGILQIGAAPAPAPTPPPPAPSPTPAPADVPPTLASPAPAPRRPGPR
jgi:vancomycin resistance protein YoaR